MAHLTNEMADLHLQQNSEEDTWNSDTKHQPNQSSSNTEELPSVEERERALRTELQTVRDINSVIEGVVESLERAKGNMENVSRTVSSASTLLDTWTRILSQTEHNQRLILNPSWQGATQDMADIENEALLKQQAAERRELEEQQRREALAQKAAEEERKRAATTVATNKNVRTISSRGRTRTVGRNPSSTSSTSQTSGSGTRGVSRGATGRGTAGLRRPPSTTTRGTVGTNNRGRLRGN
ncbi:hypothetical protein LOZ53_002377 [Ophidiomyces ophidiicola]|uniref:Uncharacterized protein n=1 Tax=Ophidiomyces ophidiicola TaxID=1387563 RepID=A0ACB8V5D0_9EURO|nr:uncharacterized protein LOZ57_006092 [Ophidiomyces ophidiicola]KAI1906680.1 hypothetical protein LOZ61_006546 [Ophidiomyces ophidiicola]KAI1923620.1 hypothetical protein LOZ64_000879 [Ophidiomyces ophidiicola]KAI1939806.1 hypothetical protein LOZ57_006092 [Ophidiomyces ophidiicola]KAI1956128.1 hypothetical protein LOZ62_000120 [Ophidiomyces ophidiicola]KAI1967811.1 hypothetical protein LOZ59_000626 [Ophidiomyces ophidiicola]